MRLFVDVATQFELNEFLLKPLQQPPSSAMVGFCTRTAKGELAGIVGFDFHRHCDITGYIRGVRRVWATEKLFEISFNFVYNHLKVERITAGIRSNNTASIHLCGRLGFRKEGILRNYFKNGEDLLLMGLLRKECKYLKNGTLSKFDKGAL